MVGRPIPSANKYHGGASVGVDESLVQDAESTVRRSEEAGGKTLYLSFNKGSDAHGDVRHTEPHILPVKLPEKSTNVKIHGPGEFEKRGHGKVFGVQITFTEPTAKNELAEHHRTIELPRGVTQVQLLDREPDEGYKAVA